MNNEDQAAKISSLVEDIRDAIMDYQVRYSPPSAIYTEFMIYCRLAYNRISTTSSFNYLTNLGNRENLVCASESPSVTSVDEYIQRIYSSLTNLSAQNTQDISLGIGRSV